MNYLGNSPQYDKTINSKEYIATAGQTVFNAVYDDYVDVYVNGVKLGASDYTANDGMTVVLAEGALLDDVVMINGYQTVGYGDVGAEMAVDVHAAASKTTPVDADELAILDSANGFMLKKLTFTNLKATLKTYFDTLYNFYSPTPNIATGTATFTATTNNINLTGIGIGVEIGDVIQISGAEDVKNNSEFTVEVITDNNNIIVNQAHANKGTSKNVANRVSDTGVTVKLLAKWYNAPIGLGQDWVDVSSSRVISTNYPNPTKRTIYAVVINTGGPAGVTTMASLSVSGGYTSFFITTSVSSAFTLSAVIPKDSTYIYNGPAELSWWKELR